MDYNELSRLIFFSLGHSLPPIESNALGSIKNILLLDVQTVY